jgi:hypothetical protein
MCLLGMASLAGRKQEQRPKLLPVSAAAAVPAQAERAAVALSCGGGTEELSNIKTQDEQAVACQASEECS